MVVSGTQLNEEEEDRRRAERFAIDVTELVEQHPLWLAAERPVDDEDQLVLDILREVLTTYTPPPPAGWVLYSVAGHDDPELQALALVVPAFQHLSPEAAARSVRYLTARYGDEADHG
jgi:hypothetical protein